MTQIHNQRPDDADACRILVISSKNGAAMVAACEAGGHETVRITRVSEGVAFLNALDHIDVVISAVHLEDDNVFELLREIKRKPHLKDVKMIMICESPNEQALAMNQSVQDASALLGCDKYLLMETFDPEWLMREVEALLPLIAKKDKGSKTAY
jgi:CheY-like chemotaxis protein